MRARILCLLALCFAMDGFAAKKDFKGLFGSYRREKFTENEGRPTDYGMDLMISTAFPITSVADSTAGGSGAMQYAGFFNAEGSLFFTLNYNWEIFLNLSYCGYSTRKQAQTDATSGAPMYQNLDMEVWPVLAGFRYRFGRTDIVPYVGLGAGLAYVRRRMTFDYSNDFDDNYSTALTGQATVGLEFFIAPRTGIRLETSAMYVNYSTHSSSGVGGMPVITYPGGNIALRYSSGLFLLF